MKGYKVNITPELIEKVLRVYKKGIGPHNMGNLGICPPDIARKILKDAGIDTRAEALAKKHQLHNLGQIRTT